MGQLLIFKNQANPTLAIKFPLISVLIEIEGKVLILFDIKELITFLE